MEDDDEFGDLYTDVLRPLTTSFMPKSEGSDAPAAASIAASSQSRPIDLNVNSDNEEILYGAPDSKNSISNSNHSISLNLNEPIQENNRAEPDYKPKLRGFDLNLDSNSDVGRMEVSAGNGGDGLEFEARVLRKVESVKLPEKASGGSNILEDDDDINIIVEEADNKDDELVEKDESVIAEKKNMFNSAAMKESTTDIVTENIEGEIGSEQLIPGLSGGLENHGVSNFEDDWDSDESEDDLQIVLNDNNHGPMDRMPGMDDEDDEDGEPLVILADDGDVNHLHPQQMTMEEQQWVGEEAGPGADGERKELGEAAKPSGGGTASTAAVPPKIGYSNHGYHHPFHSQFKYVRPGAAPMPGAAPTTTGGIPGQVRPPVPMAPAAGRGRGDWRPSGLKGAIHMQKGYHPGYGVSPYGVNAGGRGYGSGLDFTLPSHKTIFEVDIDGFEEKPWKLPGIDISDFFNFDLNEDSWKDYCKQLEQLRLETTMQSKIRVYESGRAEQNYDPDLPPELAAAVRIQDIPSENANSVKADALPTGNACRRPPLPVGRPIPVETGIGDRLPSIDTRRPRLHDTDAIIEITCHNCANDDGMAEQQDNDPAGGEPRGDDEIDDLKDETEQTDRYSHGYDGRKVEPQFRPSGGNDDIARKDVLHLSPEIQDQPDKEIGFCHVERSTKGRGQVPSPKMDSSDDEREKIYVNNQHEETFESDVGKQSPLSYSDGVGSDGERAIVITDDIKDESLIEDRSLDMEREEMAVNEINGDSDEDETLMNSTKKQKRNLNVEQLSQENDDGEESRAAISSDSKARSISSKDQRNYVDNVEDEVLQDRRPPRTGDIERSSGSEENTHRRTRHERAETGKPHTAVRGKDDSYSRKGGDSNSPLHRNMKSESADWRKKSDVSEGSWQWRDEDNRGKRIMVEDRRKREHDREVGSRKQIKVRDKERSEKDEHHQSRNQLDNGNWRGGNHDQDRGSRQRERNINDRSQNEKVDVLKSKRRKEEASISREQTENDVSHSHRESSSRRKRQRDDLSDQWKKDVQARPNDDDVPFLRQKEEAYYRDRSGRHRERDEWHQLKQSQEESLSRREKEEARLVMRSGQATQNKSWIGHSRGKDDHKVSSKEYPQKDVGRRSDQLKGRDQIENENFPLHRGYEDVYPHGRQLSNGEKRARYERSVLREERVLYASDTSRVHDSKYREGSRKVKERESENWTSLILSKRNQDEHGGQRAETVKLRGLAGHESGENEIRQSAKRHKEDASSDDEQSGSRRGRSKLERWTSHKERDFSITSLSSSSLKGKDLETRNSNDASLGNKLSEEPTRKVEDKQPPSLDDKDTVAEANNANAKTLEDKRLDTVAKLKKRSERFKLPMPSEKDAMAIKKLESEPLPSAVTETCPDSEIKPERPARKRRWTGN